MTGLFIQLKKKVRRSQKSVSNFVNILSEFYHSVSHCATVCDGVSHSAWTSEAKDEARRGQLQKSMKEWFPSKMFFQDPKRT
jgi:hypothetical protein